MAEIRFSVQASTDFNPEQADKPWRSGIVGAGLEVERRPLRAIVDAAGKVVQTLETTVVSDLDQSILPREPLVTGPAYEPNAKARDAAGKIAMRDDSACPA